MEGQNLLCMVNGRVYNAELRTELSQAGFRRIAPNIWISKDSANKYELLIAEDGDEKLVKGVDLLEGNRHVHLAAVDEASADGAGESPVEINLNIHHKTADAIMKQLEVSDRFFDIMDYWNDQMAQGTVRGQQLQTLVGQPQISWENFLFLPNPMATGEYLFATFRRGVAASIHAWLALPDERFMVPTDGTEDGAYDSLQYGREFHAWEFDTFTTPAAAGQYAIRMLNNSDTTYAHLIRQLLGKEEGKITRNDFYRNAQNIMCRIEVVRDAEGLHFTDVPALPTIADCIDCLLAPFIKARALRGE